LLSLLRRHSDAWSLALAASVYVELRVAGFGPEANGVGAVFGIFALSRLAQATLHFVARKLQP
jgi:hypothetical protein